MSAREGYFSMYQSQGQDMLKVDVGYFAIVHGSRPLFRQADHDPLHILGGNWMLRHDREQRLERRLDRRPDAELFDARLQDLEILSQAANEFFRLGVRRIGLQKVALSDKRVGSAASPGLRQSRGRDTVARRHAAEDKRLFHVVLSPYIAADSGGLLSRIRQSTTHLAYIEPRYRCGGGGRAKHIAEAATTVPLGGNRFRLESPAHATTDVVPDHHGFQKSCSIASRALSHRQRRGYHRAAGVGSGGRMGIVGLIGVRSRPVCQRGETRAREQRAARYLRLGRAAFGANILRMNCPGLSVEPEIMAAKVSRI